MITKNFFGVSPVLLPEMCSVCYGLYINTYKKLTTTQNTIITWLVKKAKWYRNMYTAREKNSILIVKITLTYYLLASMLTNIINLKHTSLN